MNPESIKTTSLENSYDTRRRVFSVSFFRAPIHTIVTSTPAVARQWIYNIRRDYKDSISSSSLVVGLGVQWNYPRTKGTSASAATLQLCIDTNCLIFQLCYPASAPATLRKFLADGRITFVGVNNGRDKKVLKNCRLELEVSNLVDLAQGMDRKYWSMEKMASYFMGADDVVKPRKLGLSNWEQFWLTNDQVQYACVDAFISFTLATQAFGYPKRPHWLTSHDDNNNDGPRSNGISSDKPEFTWYSDDENNGTVVVDARPNITWFSDDDNDDDNGAIVVNARPVFTYDGDGGNENGDNKPEFNESFGHGDGDDSDYCWYEDFRPSEEEFAALNRLGLL